MKTFALILMFISWLLVINVGLKGKFEKLTICKDWEIHTLPNWFVWIFMFFGIFMFPFYKQLREYRKNYYIIRQVQIYEQWDSLYKNMGFSQKMDEYDKKKYENYLINKRYLKLKEIQKKVKKDKIWNYLHI